MANLYELFHRFYQTGLPSVVGSDGTALYWALVQKSNELRDPRSFTFTNTEAKERSGISRDETFARARQKLLAAGLVQYSPGTIGVVGIYTDLDLELEPAMVAARLGDCSQTTHKPLTNRSQTTHKPTRETPDFVSISERREEQSREEKALPQQQEDGPAGDAEKLWQIAVEAAAPITTAGLMALLRRCRGLRVDGNVVYVDWSQVPTSDRERVNQQGLVLSRALVDATGRRFGFRFGVPPNNEARAGPERGEYHASGAGDPCRDVSDPSAAV